MYYYVRMFLFNQKFPPHLFEEKKKERKKKTLWETIL